MRRLMPDDIQADTRQEDTMQLHGFELIDETNLEELSSRVRRWRHVVTGAQLLSFCNADENKVFGVSFRTPPGDSTGVAHILEHSVLCVPSVIRSKNRSWNCSRGRSRHS